MNRQISFLLWIGCASAGIALFYLAFRYFLPWMLPFVLALAIAACLEPAVQWLRRRFGFQRGFSSASLTLLLLGLALFLLIRGFTTLAEEAYGFLQQLPSLMAPLPNVLAGWEQKLERFCAACPEGMQNWLRTLPEAVASQAPQAATRLSQELLDLLSACAEKLPDLVLFLVTTVLAVFYTTSRYPQIRAFIVRQLPERWRPSARGVKKSVLVTLSRWLRAECILILLTFVQLLAGFLLLRVDYALLMAVLTAVIDALPILGVGTVLLPWGLFCFLSGAVPRGVGLLALYAVILLVHSFMEPKLMASQAGLPPIAALAAMYLGYRSLGLAGMIFFPFLLLLLKQLQDSGWLHLWK
ncbi:sporulation integral membrane protein YtvI [Oscillibacter sp. MSJ-2]|uniref:Sporulation integral membrane protein YtvI n=1 Tax=Dysosmobacter acutus TaxID=2841504 RepID=A0ABS6F9M5_9FIRM|nr:sporulation integral membrane protein YtvI [Dysosmobacter acutus]MBU5626877.1 sporulation integral membrane protein YtvI [Dysosmobacter acutus]